MRRRRIRNYTKILKAKFPLVFTILRRDTLQKNAFQEEKKRDIR